MKRLISLLLVIVLVVGLMPTAFADGAATPDVALTLGTPTPKTVTVSGESVTYYEIPVYVKNNTSEKITLNAFECYLKFDATGFTPVELMADDGTLIVSASFGSPVSNWSSKTTEKKNDLVLATGAEGKLAVVFLNVPANGETELFKLNLKPVDGIEKGDYPVRFATREEAAAFQAKASGNQVAYDGGTAGKTVYAASENKLDCSATTTISITDGAAPTLASISVTPTTEGPAVYGTQKTFNLTATSTSGKDITNLVDFALENGNGKHFLLNQSANTVTTNDEGKTTPAGKYIVSAEAYPAGACIIPETYTMGTFTISPLAVLNLTAKLNNFGKGQDIKNAHISGYDGANLDSATWYEGTSTEKTEITDTEAKFKAATDYTLVIVLRPDDNHTFADGATLTVDSFGPVALTANGNGTYTATVTARTGAKDQLEAVTPPTVGTAKYGQKLGDISLTGGTAAVENDSAQTPVAGHYDWVDTTAVLNDVGDTQIAIRFVPDNTDLYEGFTTNISVNVGKAEIDLADEVVVRWWSNYYSSSYHTYTGEEQTVTLNIPDEFKDLLIVEYSTDFISEETGERYTTKATNVGTYATKAVLTPKYPDFYKFAGYSGGDDARRELIRGWDIEEADFTPDNVSENVSYGTTEVTIPRSELTGAVSSSDITIVLPTIDPEGALIQNAVETETGDIKLTLKATGIEDAKRSLSESITLTYASPSGNYETNNASNTITINIVDKVTDNKTVSISGPESVEYGTAYDFTYLGVPADAQLKSTAYTNTTTNVTSTYKPEDVGSYKISCTWESSTTIYTAEYVFAITARNISNATATIADLTYTGEEQTASLTVTDGKKTLTLDTDYTVAKGSLTKTDADTYTVTITGTGNYTGTMKKEYQILPCNISTVTVEAITAQTYTGSAFTPEPAVKHGDKTLTKDKDYTVSYENNTNAGTATVKITGTGNYTGTKTVEFTINAKPLTGADIADIADVTYNGAAHTPTPEVKLGDKTLTKDVDYTLSYEGNTNAGEATVTVTGTGNYSGTAKKNFTINPKTISKPNDINIDVRYTDTAEKSFVLWQETTIEDKAAVQETDCQFGAAFSLFDEYESYPVDDDPNNIKFGYRYQIRGGLKVGTKHTFVVTLTYGSNYAPSEVKFNIVFTITDKDPQAALTYTGATTMTYKQSIPLSCTGGSGSGEVSYTVENGTGEATVNGSTLTATKAGTVKLTVHKSGDNTYLDQRSEAVTITINKATPAAPAEIKADDTDTTLGELGREMVNKIGVSGTINWYDSDNKPITDPDTTKIEANKEYSWTFVPTDGTNYNEIRGKTTPYVRDDLSWLPGVINGGSNFTFHDVNRFDYYYDSVKWAADNGIASGTSRFAFSPDAVCTRAQTVTFLWRAAGSPLPRYRACPFTDVNANDYYYEAVLWAVEQGITTGLTATTFGPDETVTRGQVATFLYRAASAAKPNTFNPFMDVKPTAYNYDAILWAYDNRITTGTSTTTFSPDAFCTRAQIVTFLYRYDQGR